MTFEDAMEIVLEFEGGYVFIPNDSGGETKYGISKKSFPDVDIANLTVDQAKEIYRTKYWNNLKLDELPEVLRLPLFDAAVNQGIYWTVSTLQRMLSLKVDGFVGPTTISAVLLYKDSDGLKEAFLRKRMLAYTHSKSWPMFGAGWATRLLEVALK